MNFFQEQARAHRDTTRLILLFALAMISLIIVTLLFVISVDFFSGSMTLSEFLNNPLHYLDEEVVFGAILAILIVVGGGTLYKYSTLASGGKSVATALGGRQINHNHATTHEKTLLNVVDEMAIASGMTPPTVYLLPDESINAFAAGLTVDDAVIGISQGAVDKLSRAELQGVIAHEFSHIFNGDMRLNLHLTAILHGITLIGLIGYYIMRIMPNRSGSRKGNNGALYFLLFGLGLYVIGYGGTFLGSLIRAGVSRKREFLADATAVQYTRYPAGISGALKKISHYGSTLRSASAETYSHLYFSSGVTHFFGSLMATHPPLNERIQRIEPKWDGKIPNYAISQQEKPEEMEPDSQSKKELFAQSVIAATMLRVGTMEEAEVEETQERIEVLDSRLRERLNDPLGAQAIILALFYDKGHKEKLFSVIRKHNPYLLLEFANVLHERDNILIHQAPLLASLSLNALKSLSVEQFKQFSIIMEAFIAADDHISLFEWSLQYCIERPIALHLGLRKVPKTKHTHLGAVKAEVESLFSMLMHAQYHEASQAREAFAKVTRTLHAGALRYQPRETIDHGTFIHAIQALETVKPGVAERIFEGVLHCIKADDGISESENSFVHAMAWLLQVPLPSEFKLHSDTLVAGDSVT